MANYRQRISRQAAFDVIAAHPGITIPELAAALKTSDDTARDKIKVLSGLGLLRSLHVGRASGSYAVIEGGVVVPHQAPKAVPLSIAPVDTVRPARLAHMDLVSCAKLLQPNGIFDYARRIELAMH